MLSRLLTYSGRIWLNKLDPLVGKARNGRYFKKYRLIENNEFYTLVVFCNKATPLMELPETLVVKSMPVFPSVHTVNDKKVPVYATELNLLLKHMKNE